MNENHKCSKCGHRERLSERDFLGMLGRNRELAMQTLRMQTREAQKPKFAAEPFEHVDDVTGEKRVSFVRK